MAVSDAAAHPQSVTEVPDLVVVVLAAGEGRRLAPLTHLRPKPLCPVGGRPLLELALERAATVAAPVAVNLHHGAAAIRAHLEEVGRTDVHLSEERPEALGTAGAIAALKDWVDGRDVLVLNADTWAPGDLGPSVRGWARDRPAVVVHGDGGFGPRARIAASLLPWSEVRALRAEPTGLYEVVWRRCHDSGELAVLRHDGPFVDCGTPVDYLSANLAAAERSGGPVLGVGAEAAPGSVRGRSVVGEAAVVRGQVVDSVLWPGCVVDPDEVLVRTVRADGGLTLGPLPVAEGRSG